MTLALNIILQIKHNFPTFQDLTPFQGQLGCDPDKYVVLLDQVKPR